MIVDELQEEAPLRAREVGVARLQVGYISVDCIEESACQLRVAAGLGVRLLSDIRVGIEQSLDLMRVERS